MTDKEIKKALECLEKDTNCEDCAVTKQCKGDCVFTKSLDLINRQQAEIERLTTIAKKMHSWIFTNSYDEEKAYAECGLTDEENTLLGYCGKIVFESKEMVGEQE